MLSASTGPSSASRVSYPGDGHPHGFVDPLGGGHRRDRRRQPAIHADRSGALLLVDAATGRVRVDLGPGLAVAAGYGVVLWTRGCDEVSDGPCTLHRRRVAGGATASYHLPRPPGSTAGVLSADGRRLAFTLERAAQDPRYEQGHPMPPADIAILHLDTGALDVVPGVELAAKMSPALAFSTDGRWLVMALDAGTRTRLVAWRPGLTRPLESTPVAGPVSGAPAIVVLASHAGG